MEELTSFQMDQVFNPYTDQCPLHDDEFSVGIRLRNLESYLHQIKELEVTTAWVGEALGYRGGRRTGLPFSDENHLTNYDQLYGITTRRATISGDLGEVTASVIWEMLVQVNQLPLLWNIFPYHPRDQIPLTNRKPVAAELNATQNLTKTILDVFEIDVIYAVGRTAERELGKMGLEATYLRHPSYGGANIFRDQVREEYNLG